jgi:hypothetical protein
MDVSMALKIRSGQGSRGFMAQQQGVSSIAGVDANWQNKTLCLSNPQ